jgi:uncharacterized membrane protein
MTTLVQNSSESFTKRIRGYFFTGLLVLVPIILTVIIIRELFLAIDGILRGVVVAVLRTQFGMDLSESQIPGLGFITLVLLIFLTGVLSRQYFGKQLISIGEKLVNRIPLVKGVYGAMRQISEAFFTENRRVFNRVVLIRWPHKDSYSIGFTVQERNPLMGEVLPGDLIAVFRPSTPNPTTGFLLFVPREEVINLDISVEDALKMVISGGTIPPTMATPARTEQVDILQNFQPNVS